MGQVRLAVASGCAAATCEIAVPLAAGDRATQALFSFQNFSKFYVTSNLAAHAYKN